MARQILIGTVEGLWGLDPAGGSVRSQSPAGQAVLGLAGQHGQTWAIVNGHGIWATRADGSWEEVAVVDGWPATCLAATTSGLFVGTEHAHLLKFANSRLESIETFESVAGRETWYTPWGDPADVRSMSVDPSGALFVNVHVGGVVRSLDTGRTWSPMLDIEVDVHQVLTHPARPGVVLAAAAVGLGVSRNGGDGWQFVDSGLHARYLRAVTVADDFVLVSASTGPGGRQAAVYRRPLDGDAPFERCRVGLPRWFGDNVDTGCLEAKGSTVVAGTSDGRVFTSPDAGATWSLVAKGLPEVRCIHID